MTTHLTFISYCKKSASVLRKLLSISLYLGPVLEVEVWNSGVLSLFLFFNRYCLFQICLDFLFTSLELGKVKQQLSCITVCTELLGFSLCLRVPLSGMWRFVCGAGNGGHARRIKRLFLRNSELLKDSLGERYQKLKERHKVSSEKVHESVCSTGIHLTCGLQRFDREIVRMLYCREKMIPS